MTSCTFIAPKFIFIFFGKNRFFNLIAMWRNHIAIKLRKANTPKRKFCIFYISKAHFYLMRMHGYSICNDYSENLKMNFNSKGISGCLIGF
ncbi:hypothetical protein CN425_22905 [Bacillus cereus]|uniref:Uncharacterized protein n=1 Tax=Bacillus cereus TaxID=1396 RepID=A0A2A8PPJ6_BACCE|nr:hypothetical protein CN425_22905 [Bacillus cereus]